MDEMERTGTPLTYTDEIWIRNGERLNQKQRHRKYSGEIFEHCLPLCIISPSSAVIHRGVFDAVGVDESSPVCETTTCGSVSPHGSRDLIERQLIIMGGHPDQPRAYDGMDRFRKEYQKVLDSGALSHGQTRKAMRSRSKMPHVGSP